jgi:hypothetical protein
LRSRYGLECRQIVEDRSKCGVEVKSGMEAGAPKAISHGAGTVFNSRMLLHNEPVVLWMHARRLWGRSRHCRVP